MAKAAATIAPKLIRAIPRRLIKVTLLGLGTLALYTRSSCLRLGKATARRREAVDEEAGIGWRRLGGCGAGDEEAVSEVTGSKACAHGLEGL